MFLDKREGFLRVLAGQILGPFPDLVPRRFVERIEEALRARSPSVQRQFRLFLFVVRWLPVVRWGRRLERLSGKRQDIFLTWLQDEAPRTLQKGFWGLKTILFVGCYGDPEIHSALNYRPDRDGNTVLHARKGI